MQYLLLAILYLPLVASYTITHKGVKYNVPQYKKYGDCIVFQYEGGSKSLCKNYKIKEK